MALKSLASFLEADCSTELSEDEAIEEDELIEFTSSLFFIGSCPNELLETGVPPEDECGLTVCFVSSEILCFEVVVLLELPPNRDENIERLFGVLALAVLILCDLLMVPLVESFTIVDLTLGTSRRLKSSFLVSGAAEASSESDFSSPFCARVMDLLLVLIVTDQ